MNNIFLHLVRAGVLALAGATAGAAAMAKAGTVAVILPGAFYFIRETKKPPVDLFRKHGVRMAIATDSNPGTSPLTSLLLTMNMAATLFGMTVEECIAGTTREAARALGRSELSTVFVHVVPQLRPLATVQFGASAAAVVLGETGLSFLGFVALSGAPSLGRLLEQGVTTMLVAPHVLVAAAGAVLLTNAALLLATDGSRARAH